VSRSLTTECTLTDQETFAMKSQKKEALEEEEKEEYAYMLNK
jgi:hypothetical protein